jgi:NAD-dependent deacetylase
MRTTPIRIDHTERVFILTGAGISAESGIRTFRDAGGLWEEFRFEEVASPEGWRADPALVWRFYSQRRAQAGSCKPNAAHVALARLEETLGDRLFVCTQNVDPLHERAGSTRVVHMHGELFRSRCERCDLPDFPDGKEYPTLESIPRCTACGARIRPHICWFGEVPFEMHRIGRALDACDVFVVIGSSGAVYPAAGFVARARDRSWPGVSGPSLRNASVPGAPDHEGIGAKRARTVYVGPEEPDNARLFDELRMGKAGEVVPSLFECA